MLGSPPQYVLRSWVLRVERGRDLVEMRRGARCLRSCEPRCNGTSNERSNTADCQHASALVATPPIMPPYAHGAGSSHALVTAASRRTHRAVPSVTMAADDVEVASTPEMSRRGRTVKRRVDRAGHVQQRRRTGKEKELAPPTGFEPVLPP